MAAGSSVSSEVVQDNEVSEISLLPVAASSQSLGPQAGTSSSGITKFQYESASSDASQSAGPMDVSGPGDPGGATVVEPALTIQSYSGAEATAGSTAKTTKQDLHGEHDDGGCRSKQGASDMSKVLSDEALQQAALLGDLHAVQQLLSDGTSVNAPMQCHRADGDKFCTLLHSLSGRPAIANCREVLREIVSRKANLNARSSAGATPLMHACLHKNKPAVELLLEHGCDVRPRDDKGRDAATCCAMLVQNADDMGADPQDTSADILVLLAEKAADIDQISNIKNAPLLEAILTQNQSAVVALTELGAVARFLHQAVESASASIIETLLKAQANPFEPDTEDQTVLDVAFKRGDEEIITLLRNHIGELERSMNKTASMDRSGRGSVSNPLGPSPSASFNTTAATASMMMPGSTMAKTNSADSADTDGEGGGGLGLSSTRGVRVSKRHSGSESARRLSLRRISKTIGDHNHLFPKTPRMIALLDSPVGRWLKLSGRRLQENCLKINNNRWFQAVMLSALLTVLFLPDLWVFCDMAQNDGLDVILIFVLVLFVFEIFVQTVGLPSVYINSFFFWMDLVGACSVPLDHSAVSDNLPRNFDNAVVMRAARTARLGARAGRFTKLVKLLRFLPGVNPQGLGSGHGTAKTMSNALIQSLSTRVSCLIIVMVMVMPLFDLATYPENDFSMKTWMNALDYTMGRTPSDIEQKIADFQSFYSNKDYYPFRVTLEQPNGTVINTRLRALAPRRTKNEITITADSGSVWAVFNFGIKNRVDALCNMMLIATIIALMMGFSLLLSNSVSTIVLLPLESLLSGVKKMASKIFKSVTSMTKNVAESEGSRGQDELFGNETELLEKVIDKLAALNAITMKTNPVDAETLWGQGFHGAQSAPAKPPPSPPPAARTRSKKKERLSGASSARADGESSSSSDDEGTGAANTETLVFTLERHLEEAQLDWAAVDSAEFNVMAIDDKQRHLVCLCCLIFHLGLQYHGDKHQTLASFTKAAASGYSNSSVVPYHNWVHAVDVTHSVFRMMNTCCLERFLSYHERYSLVVSALCHDIGHPGLNNPYLVETSHELAIRYNDRSPLENMHCAKLFELVNAPKTAVFSQFGKNEVREARQVCIEAILHTDNTHHFGMVKELQMLYEMNSDVFDMSLQMYQTSKIDFPPKEIVDIYSEPEKKKLMRNLCLHSSDVSNPTKPFDICHAWAWAIVDEFFLQGDQEKKLGVTVQPLNDREKVNRPYSQVGFIEFFVAPFTFATVRLLPPLMASTDQMIKNLHSWCEEWVNTTIPVPAHEERVKLQDRITKLEAKYSF